MKILILFLTLWSCNNERNIQMINDEFLFKVDFQDFFEKDKVTFYLNDCLVFEDVELNSDKSVGLTRMVLNIRRNNNLYSIDIKDDEGVDCVINEDSINLKIIVNQEVGVFNIDLNNGKYLGFDKGANNKVELNQSTRPFEYD